MHIIPQLRDLEKQFGDSLVVIGVHSPKFANERVDANVREAILRYNIDHPVVNDAQLSLWRTLGVQSWPTVVLVDPDGYLAGFVEGEGVKAGLMPLMQRVSAAYQREGKLDLRPLALALESAKMKPSALAFPGKITFDATGKRLFVSDSGHNRIVILGLDGNIEGAIGTGAPGRADGSLSQATFHSPQGTALVGSTLYVADTENHLVRAVDLQQGKVSTVAGTGRQEELGGAGGPALRTAISSPWDVTALNGVIYIAMAGDHRIWKYDPVKKTVSPYAGTGREGRQDGDFLAAWLAQPSGITNDGRYLYVADSESSSIRRLDPRLAYVTTLAGGDLFDFGHRDARGLGARFQHPLGIAYADGKLYIADTYNSDIRVLDLTTRVVSTLAGVTEPGFADGTAARFFEPGGLTLVDGRLYVADTDNGAIRVVDPRSGDTSTVAVTIRPAGATVEESAIEGTVSLGPVAPVTRPGVPNTKPYAARVEVRRPDGTLVAATNSGDDGHYRVSVPPGEYRVSVGGFGRQPYPRSPVLPVTVHDGQSTTVDLSLDSGIR